MAQMKSSSKSKSKPAAPKAAVKKGAQTASKKK